MYKQPNQHPAVPRINWHGRVAINLKEWCDLLQTGGAMNYPSRRTRGTESSPWPTSSRKMGTPVLQLQGSEICQPPVSLEENPHPQLVSWFQPGKTLSRESSHAMLRLLSYRHWDNKLYCFKSVVMLWNNRKLIQPEIYSGCIVRIHWFWIIKSKRTVVHKLESMAQGLNQQTDAFYLASWPAVWGHALFQNYLN